MRSSSKMFLIAGSLFALVGFLFVIIFFVITANLDEVMRHARGDAWLIQPMFGILGFMCLIMLTLSRYCRIPYGIESGGDCI